MQPFDVVERRARDIRQCDLVDEHYHAAEIRHPVAFLLRVEIQRILKPGASSTDHSDSHPVLRAEAFLRVHLADHLDRFGREIHIRQRRIVDRLSRRLLLGMLVLMLMIMSVPVMLDIKSVSHFR